MLLKDIKDKMELTPGISKEEQVTRKYAKEIFETFMDRKNLIVFDDVETLGTITENDLLIGFWDWQMYSDHGNSLFWDNDIMMRLYGKKLSEKEQKKLAGTKNLLTLQAEALEKAGTYILNLLKEVQYEPVKAEA